MWRAKESEMASRPRVLITRRWPEAVEQRLAARFDATLNAADERLSPEVLAQAFQDYDAICPNVSNAVGADLMGEHPRVRIIGNYGVGYNNIDVAAAKARGIVVTNTPDVLTEATADLALTLMLMIARRAGEGERLVRAGQWTGWGPTHMLGAELGGKTLGLVGFGRIAQATARKAVAAFGMKVIYYSRSAAPPEVEAQYGASRRLELDDLLAESDVVSLHCPATPETHRLIGAERLARMKPTAFLINTARGAVVDEAALAQALSQRVIAGAGLDVYDQEPIVHPALLALENVVLLPHLGSATLETRTAMGMRVADNLEAFFDGKEPGDRVA
jgi:lactate dehydrogenase-like 2-hydroxyacid dehydrogenase